MVTQTTTSTKTKAKELQEIATIPTPQDPLYASPPKPSTDALMMIGRLAVVERRLHCLQRDLESVTPRHFQQLGGPPEVRLKYYLPIRGIENAIGGVVELADWLCSAYDAVELDEQGE